MKFIFAMLICGVFLIAAPLASYSFYIAEFTKIASIVVKTTGNVNFPDIPVTWYVVSAGSGGAMVIISVILGIFMQCSRNLKSIPSE